MNVTASDIGGGSIHMDTTMQTGKRRDLAPLNVYVRIRPFIGDELERAENQALIDILDDKRIAVKVYPAMSNAIRTLQSSYNEYEVTRIFDHRCSQQELYEHILDKPTKEIFTGSNWLLCTLGLTNSGKTHTMFGTAEEPGLIPKCLQSLFSHAGQRMDDQLSFKPDGLENLMPTSDCQFDTEIAARNYIFPDEKRRMRLPNLVQQQDSFQDLSAGDEHYSIWISFFELYNENILDLLVQPKHMKTRKNLRLLQNENSTMIRNLIQIPVFDIKEAEDIIKFGFSNRSTSKTNLNDASSRSHAVICITLITINEFDEEPTMSHMYICDLAGNEPSSGTGKQLAETCNINSSLMTFKACIRVLNENQAAKKQMLIPYRNSVLTSIFRPFFVGRGRTIICCNVNPCATFITQTNDLLKFCALAQKTIIVPTEPKTGAGLIRPQRKSKNKGPKRLGKDTVLRDKNGKNTSARDEIDDTQMESINELPTTVPTNTKSINYWRNVAAKALTLLQKQASNRRSFIIERHREHVQTVQYFLDQRRQIDHFLEDKQSNAQKYDALLAQLHLEQDQHLGTQQLYSDLLVNEKKIRQKVTTLENEHQERDRHLHDEKDALAERLQTLQAQLEQNQSAFQAKEAHLQEEIQRLKRDLGLELFRKQDAEKKVRTYEEKLRVEQAQFQKTQYDYIKAAHDLNTLQAKYNALQLDTIEAHQETIPTPIPIIEMVDARTSNATVQEEPSEEKPMQKGYIRAKRCTNDEDHVEPEVKKPRRMPRNQSKVSVDAVSLYDQEQVTCESNTVPKRVTRNATTQKTIPIPIKLTKRKLSAISQVDSRVTTKTSVIRSRTKKLTIDPPTAPNQEESHSPIYATIQRKTSLDRTSVATVVISTTTEPTSDTTHATPKPSTFKRIQSFFRVTPTLTSSARMNRALQMKSTVVAFGSSTPIHRPHPTIVKTPGPTVQPTPSASMAQKNATPKSRYNLRTRLFNNPPVDANDDAEKASRGKKPSRPRK